ncbi:hypothetical protein ACH5RR_018513 [Cinchona calisaya]|uniref:Uncharacterized protein n=1 Tax=Cinchona calisaya TaxID=153742 RepID=A0ABD2ZLM8_9GENT
MIDIPESMGSKGDHADSPPSPLPPIILKDSNLPNLSTDIDKLVEVQDEQPPDFVEGQHMPSQPLDNNVTLNEDTPNLEGCQSVFVEKSNLIVKELGVVQSNFEDWGKNGERKGGVVEVTAQIGRSRLGWQLERNEGGESRMGCLGNEMLAVKGKSVESIDSSQIFSTIMIETWGMEREREG